MCTLLNREGPELASWEAECCQTPRSFLTLPPPKDVLAMAGSLTSTSGHVCVTRTALFSSILGGTASPHSASQCGDPNKGKFPTRTQLAHAFSVLEVGPSFLR